MIFEENIERTDFLEIILSDEEVANIHNEGIIREFPVGLHRVRPLNIHVRLEKKRRKSCP
jgi:hypothetical protein